MEWMTITNDELKFFFKKNVYDYCMPRANSRETNNK